MLTNRIEGKNSPIIGDLQEITFVTLLLSKSRPYRARIESSSPRFLFRCSVVFYTRWLNNNIGTKTGIISLLKGKKVILFTISHCTFEGVGLFLPSLVFFSFFFSCLEIVGGQGPIVYPRILIRKQLGRRFSWWRGSVGKLQVRTHFFPFAFLW